MRMTKKLDIYQQNTSNTSVKGPKWKILTSTDKILAFKITS